MLAERAAVVDWWYCTGIAVSKESNLTSSFLRRHMIKDQWLVETVVSMKGKFASYAVLR